MPSEQDIYNANTQGDIADDVKWCKDTLTTLLANLLDPALIRPGVLRFGANRMQLDNNGEQLAAPNGSVAYIYVVPELMATPPGTGEYAYFSGQNSGSSAALRMDVGEITGTRYLQLELLGIGTTSEGFSLLSDQGYVLASRSSATLFRAYTDYPFRLYLTTSDPPTDLIDGMEWYRTDTNKFRGRANSTTDNFAMEAWVTAGFVAGSGASTDYAHSLMLMGG